MPGSDSPPPFAIRFRAREPQTVETRLYQQTLELTALIDVLITRVELARFHLRDLLDRDATFVALSCGRALTEVAPSERRRLYRAARPRAIECGTILDILAPRARQGAEPGRGSKLIIEDARALLADIISKLEHLAAR
jgi:hypothetical protein